MKSKIHHPKAHGDEGLGVTARKAIGEESIGSSRSESEESVVDAALAPAHTRATAKRFLDDDERHHLIERAAYFRAADRGFQYQDPLNDWLKAQAEINEVFSGEQFLAT